MTNSRFAWLRGALPLGGHARGDFLRLKTGTRGSRRRGPNRAARWVPALPYRRSNRLAARSGRVRVRVRVRHRAGNRHANPGPPLMRAVTATRPGQAASEAPRVAAPRSRRPRTPGTRRPRRGRAEPKPRRAAGPTPRNTRSPRRPPRTAALRRRCAGTAARGCPPASVAAVLALGAGTRLCRSRRRWPSPRRRRRGRRRSRARRSRRRWRPSRRLRSGPRAVADRRRAGRPLPGPRRC